MPHRITTRFLVWQRQQQAGATRGTRGTPAPPPAQRATLPAPLCILPCSPLASAHTGCRQACSRKDSENSLSLGSPVTGFPCYWVAARPHPCSQLIHRCYGRGLATEASLCIEWQYMKEWEWGEGGPPPSPGSRGGLAVALVAQYVAAPFVAARPSEDLLQLGGFDEVGGVDPPAPHEGLQLRTRPASHSPQRLNGS